MKPLVSILIPAKNETAFLEDCLKSIQNQTYQNWECIVVDDHSTDNTSEIIHKFVEADNRFQGYKNKNKGIIEALRLAYRNSAGEYISRMDADDLMTENRVELLLNNLLEYGERHVSVGKVKYFSKKELGTGFLNYQDWLNQLTERGNNFKDIFKECVIPSPCWMVHRKDLEDVNAFNENRYPEDYDLAFRFYEANYNVVPCDEVLHYWRDYSTRTSRTDENYADHTFTVIKTHYFFKLKRNEDKELVIIGAGQRGKKLVKHLNLLQEEFRWVDQNPNKIGKHIYDVLIHKLDQIQNLEDTQVIVTVSNEKAKDELRKIFKNYHLVELKDYFFFA
jgi:glycosyltransferase involved in cell wall biosynthesis